MITSIYFLKFDDFTENIHVFFTSYFKNVSYDPIGHYALLCISMHFYAFLCISMHFYAFLCISMHFYALCSHH